MNVYAEMLNASATRTLTLQTVIGQRQQPRAALAGEQPALRPAIGQNGNLANPVPDAVAILLGT